MPNSNNHDANDSKSYAVIAHQQWIYFVIEWERWNKQTNEVLNFWFDFDLCSNLYPIRYLDTILNSLIGKIGIQIHSLFKLSVLFQIHSYTQFQFCSGWNEFLKFSFESFYQKRRNSCKPCYTHSPRFWHFSNHTREMWYVTSHIITQNALTFHRVDTWPGYGSAAVCTHLIPILFNNNNNRHAHTDTRFNDNLFCK